ncbi:hemimethylated DNA binding domain-containing protein [Xylona heveae TC161]|uniref:Hemimethylated DNA binding domain-containing protein n=1 Tax=Xylona heveae (strain CBS 132557 / TC161) TaxID=1328760 RepID=A0A165JCV4_XYLHT|nr:hemimethylated DNA binding domain-containing protein [Xylona heveae TC161]KZF26066.1 hemimethylated DNA binding domain-containing protein [Xylona heveae TC161]
MSSEQHGLFLSLPDEVIQSIFWFVPAESLASIQSVCKRFRYLAIEPILWRHLCLTRFRYWDPTHLIKQKSACPVAQVDWRQLFVERALLDRKATKLLDSILASQKGRIDKFQAIVNLGYGAKDTLLQHLHVSESAEDVLARRYYSSAVLGCLHRNIAIQEWCKLKEGQHVTLDRALGAFDMFVLEDREGDLEDVSHALDALAERFREQTPDLDSLSPRAKATQLASFLRARGFIEVPEGRYDDLQNRFIGIALLGHDHPSLPLISVAVFCCVAQRIGLDARPCSFPFHVHAMVLPPAGQTLDGRQIPSSPSSTQQATYEDPWRVYPPSAGQTLDGASLLAGGSSAAPQHQQIMYLDPYRSDSEVHIRELESQLVAIGAEQSTYPSLLGDSTNSEMVLRNARNIMKSVQDNQHLALTRQHAHRHHHLTPPPPPEDLKPFPDLEGAFYSALWASLLLGVMTDGPQQLAAASRRRQYLPYFVEHFVTHFPHDVSLFERYIIPLFQNLSEYQQLLEATRVMRAGDLIPKKIIARSGLEGLKLPRYKVGQVFRHKRYAYEAVITGWDAECRAAEHWMQEMEIDRLSRGRYQSFYHVLVEDKSVRYVAEENMQIITPEVPYSLLPLAGRYFKRWDKENRVFVSNIKDEYPDD